MKINNIECRIKVNGDFATEYREKGNQSSSRKSCYIASRSHRSFGFHLDFTHPSWRGRHVHQKYFCDGTARASTTFEVFRHLGTHTQDTSLVHLPNGSWEARPFYFEKLEVSEPGDENVEDRPEVLKDMGTLKVKVWETEAARIYDPEDGENDNGIDEEQNTTEPDTGKTHSRRESESSSASSSSSGSSSSSASSVSEKSIPQKLQNGRSVSHKTSLGRPRILGDKTSRTRRKHPCLATFVFKYLSEEKLKEEGIIPPSPKAIPVEPAEGGGGEQVVEMELDTKKEEQEEEYYLPSPTVEEVMRYRLNEDIPPPREGEEEGENGDESKIDGVRPLPVAEIFVDDWIDFP